MTEPRKFGQGWWRRLEGKISRMRSNSRNMVVVPALEQLSSGSHGSKADSDDEPTLCDDCKLVLEKLPSAQSAIQNGSPIPILKTTGRKVETQAASCCLLCKLFIDRGLLEMRHEGDLTYALWPQFDQPNIVKLDLGLQDIILTRKLAQTDLEDAERGIYYRSVSSAILHELAAPVNFMSIVNQARYWLQRCAQQHTYCRRGSASLGSFCPSRLIHINRADPTILRLVERKDMPVDTRYMTLSHCWGDSPPFRLLQQNYTRLKEKLSYHKLPKTFKDAVLISWALNTSYIWIDSLCIIQDSLEDWRYESAMMGTIYTNGQCNLCATAASDSSQGLFTLLQSQKTAVKLRFQDDEVAQRYCAAHDNMFQHDVAESPLLARAWVFQERFLSSCNLHFASSQMFWECSDGYTPEAYMDEKSFLSDLSHFHPSGKKIYSRIHNLQIAGPENSACNNDADEQQLELKLLKIWLDWIIEKFSHRLLTRDSDRLIALSGVASHFRATLALAAHDGSAKISGYYAGIWGFLNQKYVIHQLLWRTQGDYGHGGYRSDKYIAPSWSWASINFGVFHSHLDVPSGRVEFGEAMLLADIVSMRTELVDQTHSFGQVTDGALTLHTKVATTYLEGKRRETGVHGLDSNYLESVNLHFDLGYNFSEVTGKVIYLVPLRALKHGSATRNSPASVKIVEGLILISASDSTTIAGERASTIAHLPSNFRRAGIWDMSLTGIEPNHIRQFSAALQYCEDRFEEQTVTSLTRSSAAAYEAFGIGGKGFEICII